MDVLEEILAKVKGLPVEAQMRVLRFVEGLAGQTGGKRRSLYGLWADAGLDLKEEEIDRARHELWAGIPRNDL